MIRGIRIFCISLCMLLAIRSLIPQPAQAQPSASASKHPAANDRMKQELQLASDYMAGRNVPRDLTQAAYWFRKAADHGCPDAQAQLGYFYMLGLGVERSEVEAVKWFTRASASGSQPAKLNLAALYLRGSVAGHDPHLGFVILQELADKRYPAAEDYLGVSYFLGLGVAKDAAKAEEWFDRAAKHESPQGEYAMGSLYSTVSDHPHDFAKAADYLRASANSGYVAAMHALGLLLVNHPEIAQQPGEAHRWLESAAEGGSYRASIVLGILSRDGRGVSKDQAEAYRWFTVSARQGGEPAETLLRTDMNLARKTLTPEQQHEAEQTAQEWLSAHPHHDIFLHSDGMNYAYFPMGEVYATAQGVDRADEKATTN